MTLGRFALLVGLAGVAMVLAHLFDKAAYHALLGDEARLERRDWYRLARVMGYLPTWALVAAAMVLARPEPRQARRGVALVLAPALAGGAAELLKRVIARERPTEAGEYLFRPLFSGFANDANLGIPSSHAAVAAGAATVLALAFPRCAVPALLVAAACGASRMMAGAHFLSDVALGLLLGVAAGWAVRRLTA
jgi:membrane-associated phospholipid phosphatase